MNELLNMMADSVFHSHALAPVVQKVDSAIHRIKICLVDNAIGFPNTYPLDSDLSGGLRYPTFEQPGPERYHGHHGQVSNK